METEHQWEWLRKRWRGMGKIITLQKDVREGECRGLGKMVLEGEKPARWLKPPKTITELVSK